MEQEDSNVAKIIYFSTGLLYYIIARKKEFSFFFHSYHFDSCISSVYHKGYDLNFMYKCRYEKELMHPIQNLLSGELARAMLIQVM